MGMYLTSGVTSKPQDFDSSVQYHCAISEKSSAEWPMKSISTFFDKEKPKVGDIAYGIIVDCDLSIPVDSGESIHSAFTIMEFDAYKKDFSKFNKTFHEVLKDRIRDQHIVKIWKNSNTITKIGVSEELTIGTSDSKLAAIGRCHFEKDAFTISNSVSFFCNNKPTCFSVEHLKDAKLISMDSEEYNRFTDEFEKAHLHQKRKLERTESSYEGIGQREATDDLEDVPLDLSPPARSVVTSVRITPEEATSGCCVLL